MAKKFPLHLLVSSFKFQQFEDKVCLYLLIKSQKTVEERLEISMSKSIGLKEATDSDLFSILLSDEITTPIQSTFGNSVNMGS